MRVYYVVLKWCYMIFDSFTVGEGMSTRTTRIAKDKNTERLIDIKYTLVYTDESEKNVQSLAENKVHIRKRNYP